MKQPTLIKSRVDTEYATPIVEFICNCGRELSVEVTEKTGGCLNCGRYYTRTFDNRIFLMPKRQIDGIFGFVSTRLKDDSASEFTSHMKKQGVRPLR